MSRQRDRPRLAERRGDSAEHQVPQRNRGYRPYPAIHPDTAINAVPTRSAMNSTESSTALAHRARTATETSTDALNLKRGTKTLTDRADLVAQLPTLDLTGPVARYFEYVQKSVDLNRDLAIRWAELV